LDWLEGDLRRRLHLAAKGSGMTVAALCELWLRESLERFEAQHPVEDPDGSGRCSLRTGTCSLGPVPLPVQQSSREGAAVPDVVREAESPWHRRHLFFCVISSDRTIIKCADGSPFKSE
jgi:hypothetical protein